MRVLSLLPIFTALALSACASQTSRHAPPAPAQPPPAGAAPQAAIEVPHTEATRESAERTATAEKKSAAAHMPDPSLTPGHASYRTLDQICKSGSAKDERNVSESEKNNVYKSYGVAKCEGYCSGPQGCEIDHLISLEIGGANTEDNLWPQPYDGDWNAHDKDRLENTLHKLVCAKKIALKEAQEAISQDWVAAYQKYVGDRKTFKPTVRCK